MSSVLIMTNLLFLYFSLKAQEKDYKDTNKLFFHDKYFFDSINPQADGTICGNEFIERRKRSATIRNSYYSKQLLSLKEPKLYQEYPHDVYRFTWFGYFGQRHNPFTIRIEDHNESVFVVSKFISRDKNKKESLFVNDTIFLDNKTWIRFNTMIKDINFWEIPSIEKSSIVVMDGSTWILEGKKNYIYHAVFRINGKDKEIGDICLFLLRLSNLKIKNKELY